IEAVGEDQLQQQIERPLEIAQPDLEAALVGLLLRLYFRVHAPNRSMTSRANDRYASAAPDFGAHVVIGSPATLVSGKRTVRVMTVSNTKSPNLSMTRAITSRALTVRGSNRVIRMPLMLSLGLSRSCTLSTVSV